MSKAMWAGFSPTNIQLKDLVGWSFAEATPGFWMDGFTWFWMDYMYQRHAVNAHIQTTC